MTSSTHAAVSILIGANLGKSFRDSFGLANKQLTSLGDAIKKVNNQSSAIEAFRQSSRATKEAALAYQQAKQKLSLLSLEISKTDKPTKELQNNFRKAELAVNKAKTAFMESASSLREMSKSLRANGVDLKNLNQQQITLGKTLETLKSRQLALQANADAKSRNLSNRANYRAQMFDALALGGTLYSIVKPAVEFEYAMARVGAVTEETADSDNFKKLTTQARELGRTTQYTATQAAKAMQFLGMAGYNANQILATTPAILNLAIADNMELGQAADIVSGILNGFALKAEDAARASDVLTKASVVTTTNVTELGEALKFVAPAAATVGSSLEETTALIGILSSANIKSTMAGTMMRSAYLRLAAPVHKGAEALGQMREQMKITAEEMPDAAKEAVLAQNRLKGLGVKIFDQGKMRSMVSILRDLNKATRNLADDQKLGVIKDIFGTYSTVGSLAIFKNFDTGLVDQVLNKLKNADGTAKSIANRLSNTAYGAFRQLDSSVESIGISLGNTLLPGVSQLARGLAKTAEIISNMAERFPTVTKYATMAITGLVSLKIATIALGYAFTFLKGGVLAIQGTILAFRTSITLLGLAMPVITTAIKAMSLALLTSPITWIIAGIAGAAYLLIKNWTPVGEFFKNLFSGIVGWAENAFNSISKFISPLKPVIDKVGNFAGKAWDFVAGDSNLSNPDSSRIVGNAISNLESDKTAIANSPALEIANIKTPTASNQSASINISAPITINNNGSNLDEKKIANQVKAALDETFRKLSARKLALNYD